MKNKILLSFFFIVVALCAFGGVLTASAETSAETSYEDYEDLKNAEDEYNSVDKPSTDYDERNELFIRGADIVMSNEVGASFARVIKQFSDFCNIKTYMVFGESKLMTDIELFALLGGISIVGALVLHGKSATE